jgi:general secretion pathway protein N
MFKLWQFILFFLLCLLVALLFNLPIQQVLPYVKLPSTVQLVGINGTVFKGTSQEISINGFPLRALNYGYIPSCIPLLKVCYKITYEHGTIQLAYDVLNGDTEISRARIEYPVADLLEYVPNLLVNPLGQVELGIDDLSIVQGKPATLNGKLIWRDMGLDNDGAIISIGDFQIDFSGDQKKYDFKLKDLDASLDVTGEGEVKADGQYSVDIKITAETSIEPNVKNVLDLVTSKAGYNKYRFEQTGRLPAHLARQLFK